jgi:hypothetical protein
MRGLLVGRCGTLPRRFLEELLPRLQPGSELQHDAVGIHEIDRANDGGLVYCLAALARRAVVIDERVGDTFGGQQFAIFVDLLRRNIESNVVHGSVRRDDIPGISGFTDIPSRRGDAWCRVGRITELKKREQITFADVEEEVMPGAPGQLNIADQWHPEEIAVKVDGSCPVTANEREMVNSTQLKLRIFRSLFGAHVCLREETSKLRPC